jgi:acyl-CoA dehydrogenase
MDIILNSLGIQSNLNDLEKELQARIHTFSEQILRPVGIELDKLNPEEVIASESKLWKVLAQAKALGLDPSVLQQMEPLQRARIEAIAFEELAWGDVGLALTIGAAMLPSIVANLLKNPFLIEASSGKLGCWAITEPDHGTDMLDSKSSISNIDSFYGTPNCIVRIEEDRIVINGKKSQWVSNGSIAEVALLCCHAKVDGEIKPGAVVYVPLDASGVSRGAPLDKLGQRSLNQGGLYFDDVELPITYLAVGPERYHDLIYTILTEANAYMGSLFVGVARAAYEQALAYAQMRCQGGVPIIQHQNVRYRLFHMFRKIEAARALSFKVKEFNASSSVPALHASIATKITSTQTAFEVSSDAIGIFGGRGLTKEFCLEKIFRDARASLVEDGCNEVLAIKGGSLLT